MKHLIPVVLISLVVGCTSEVDEPWELDHDRIIAVRATPPRIAEGAQSELDTLVGRKGGRVTEEIPPGAMVVSPESLASALRFDAGKWVVTAPDEATLAATRTELGLEAGAPVPLVVGVAFPATAFPMHENSDPVAAVKTIWLGDTGDNPVPAPVTIDGDIDPPTPLVVAPLTDIRLSTDVAETDDVTWLASCGTMHDFDLPQAYLRVEVGDRTEGELAVIVRTAAGGVVWRIWSIRAE